MKTQRPAISYTRFSKGPQMDGDSLRRQTDRTRAFCKQHNLRLIEELQDLGISAFHGKNLGEDAKLGALLKRIKAGGLPQDLVIVVESLDRISRDKILRCQNILTDILLSGVGLAPISFNGQILTENSVNENPTLLILAIVESIRGGNESQTKSMRILESFQNMREKIKRGEKVYFGGLMPSYIRGVEDNRWLVDEDKANLVKRIFSEYLTGKAMTKVAKDLNHDEATGRITAGGMKMTKNRSHWSQATVKCILENPAVTGLFRQGRIKDPKSKKTIGFQFEHPNYLPVLVTPSDFEQVQRLMKRNHDKKGGSASGAIRNIFNGLIKCAHCGGSAGAMTTFANGKPFSYYTCLSARSGKCQHKGSFNAHLFELYFFTFVLGKQPTALTEQDKESEIKINLRRAEVSALDKKIKDTTDLIGTVDVSELKTKLMELKDRRLAVLNEVEELKETMAAKADVPSAVKNIKGLLQQLETTDGTMDISNPKFGFIDAAGYLSKKLHDNEVRKELLNTLPNLIQRIDIDPDKRAFQVKFPTGKLSEWVMVK